MCVCMCDNLRRVINFIIYFSQKQRNVKHQLKKYIYIYDLDMKKSSAHTYTSHAWTHVSCMHTESRKECYITHYAKRTAFTFSFSSPFSPSLISVESDLLSAFPVAFFCSCRKCGFLVSSSRLGRKRKRKSLEEHTLYILFSILREQERHIDLSFLLFVFILSLD